MTSITATPEKTAAAPDYAAIKQRQQATWASGDYTIVGTTLQIVGETLAEAVDVRSGERVLDVAAGNGNATLAAARRFADVTSTDYVQALLDKGRGRAAAEGLDVRFEVADAEALPYEAGSFDVALSTFGVMFAPDHASAARELIRVVRPGGRIGMANWTPEGFIGRLFKIIGSHVAPPAGVRSPALWGTEAHLVSLFGPRAKDIQVKRKMFSLPLPLGRALRADLPRLLRPDAQGLRRAGCGRQAALERDILALLNELDIGKGRGLVVPSEYAETVITVG
jgi:SAM-dependent methyltransferase